MTEEPAKHTPLKDCPFCAKNAEKNKHNYPTNVGCGSCTAMVNDDYPDDAAKHWNHRPIEDALRRDVGVLREALKKAETKLGNMPPSNDGIYDEIRAALNATKEET